MLQRLFSYLLDLLFVTARQAVAARGQGAPGQMTWLKGFRPGCRPGFHPGCHFFLLKEINAYRRGTNKKRRSFCQFSDRKNVK